MDDAGVRGRHKAHARVSNEGGGYVFLGEGGSPVALGCHVIGSHLLHAAMARIPQR